VDLTQEHGGTDEWQWSSFTSLTAV